MLLSLRLRLFFTACVFLVLLAPRASLAQPTSPMKEAEGRRPMYPDMWSWPQTSWVYRQEAGEERFRLPNGEPDLLRETITVEKTKEGRYARVRRFETLFGGKRVPIASFDEENAIITLLDGSKMRLGVFPVALPPGKSGMHEYEINGRVTPIQFTYPTDDGAMFGIERLDASVFETVCEPVDRGIAYIDASDHVKWRKIFVEHIPDLRNECGFGKRLQYLAPAVRVYPLSDGTSLITLARTMIRVDTSSGATHDLPNDVRIIDTDDFLSFRKALNAGYEKMGFETSFLHHGRNSVGMRSNEIDAAYSLSVQYFFFPELLLKK